MDYKDPIEVAKQLLAEENSAVVDVVEVETILDLDDEQDTEGKKPKIDTDKGTEGKDKKNKASLNMKPSKASGKIEKLAVTKEHLDALFTGEELTEEFKEKASTIFEAAINEKATEVEAELHEQFEATMAEAVEDLQKEVTERLDDYLGYVVEEWMKENELAVERGIRTEIAEDFITGLKSLFKEHYIDVPEEKYNVLDDLTNQTKDLESKLNEQIEKNVELTKTNSEFSRASLVSEVSADLAETEKEKFVSMAENVDFDSAEKFKEKLETVKESFFPKTKSEITENSVDSVAANLPSDFTSGKSDAMAAYTAAITKDIKYGETK